MIIIKDRRNDFICSTSFLTTRPRPHGLRLTSLVYLYDGTARTITWTVYGTFLPGDARGWRHRSQGGKLSRPRLERWARDQLKHDIVLLNQSMRDVATAAVEEICRFRGWNLWAVSIRTNHAHVVVTAPEYDPETVRDQLKAKATRELRDNFATWKNRPVWSRKGDIEFLDTEDDIESCVIYVREAQDRKGRDHM